MEKNGTSNTVQKKCKVMEINSKKEGQWILGNHILEVVNTYTYLGLEITGQSRRETEKN